MTGRRLSSGAASDADISARPVHLFRAGRWRAVTLAADGNVLPPMDEGTAWIYEGLVPLGVTHVEMPGTEPEPVLGALAARSYYVWKTSSDEEAAL